ncbi:MAG: hypothetical protein V1930_03700 [Pseudomonadota bacterium]
MDELKKASNLRREEGILYERPEFLSVQFSLGGPGNREKLYNLNVLDGSRQGLGILVAQEDFDLIKLLRGGQKIQGMRFFAPWAMIEVDAVVRHISKITAGKYKGYCLVGIESQEILERYKSDQG